MKNYIIGLQSRCYDAADGKLTDEQIQALADEAMGAFGNLPIFGVSVQRAIKARNWNMLAGAIGSCMQIDSQADRTTVTQIAQSSANATVEVTFHQTIRALDSCNLDDGTMKEIKAAIVDLEAAKDDRPESICQKASKLLDLVKKGADTAKAVAPFVAHALSLIS